MRMLIGIFLKGVIFLIIGFYLSSQGVPSNPEEVILRGGEEFMEDMQKQSDHVVVKETAEDLKSTYRKADFWFKFIGVIEVIFSGIALLFLIIKEKF